MPKRTDLRSIMILGSGPIVIGQACEFDYSGVQACMALRAEGYRVILVNSNPATIMTDPEWADATYIEPLHWSFIAKIIEKERPDGLLPTLGGQTALNCAMKLVEHGILKRFACELLGADAAAIATAEDREQFRACMQANDLAVPVSGIAHCMDEAWAVQEQIGSFPLVIRPSFTLGGSGGGIAYHRDEFVTICERGLELSPTNELLIEKSLIGWKEFEMEVVCDQAGQAMIICSIENIDPMGVHTGDSMTVAPAQTLTDKEYQLMRDQSIKVLRAVGVATGGANVQFAVEPTTGEMVVIEMNPRVSRSSALASKATGFPIAKIASLLAVGYRLEELRNDFAGGAAIPASFEPTIDYTVVKIPRFNFDKFPESQPVLTTQMKAVGEVMAIGRCFQEALQKALLSLDIGLSGLKSKMSLEDVDLKGTIRQGLMVTSPDRLLFVADAFRFGFGLDAIYHMTLIDHWFLQQIEELVQLEQQIQTSHISQLKSHALLRLKRKGFSDLRLAELMHVEESVIREKRYQYDIHPVYKRVDSCSAEFQSDVAYLYSTYESCCEANPSQQKKIVVLGSGPNRIGQGIEFDYCCVHALQAASAGGYESIMINCNPETVSTDYHLSDRLYVEPLSLEHVLEVMRVEQPTGCVVQFGGQTPLKLASMLAEAGIPIMGTQPKSIDFAEDREKFSALVAELGLAQPDGKVAKSHEQALHFAKQLGFPLMVRPSYVLGGQSMMIVQSVDELKDYLKQEWQDGQTILLDRFLADATEFDVDVIADADHVAVVGVMQHIEQAGIHSGDSACCLPAYQLAPALYDKLVEASTSLAKQLDVVGLMNAQFALQQGKWYVLEVNPRAARTVPFVAKATGYPIAKWAMQLMLGQPWDQVVKMKSEPIGHYSVKLPVFPFDKFPGSDPILGPVMKSTGEVMGMGSTFAEAYGKAQWAAYGRIVRHGSVFISVKDSDKVRMIPIAHAMVELGFIIYSTKGTASALQASGISCQVVKKVQEGHPHVVDLIKHHQIDLIINTTEGRRAIADSYVIRRSAVRHHISYMTTVEGAEAHVAAVRISVEDKVSCLQQWLI